MFDRVRLNYLNRIHFISVKIIIFYSKKYKTGFQCNIPPLERSSMMDFLPFPLYEITYPQDLTCSKAKGNYYLNKFKTSPIMGHNVDSFQDYSKSNLPCPQGKSK